MGNIQRTDEKQKSNHFLTVKGVTKTIKDWAEVVGINEQTLCERAKRGWTDEQIVLTKLKKG
jgi:hypothetical protein